MKKKSIFAMLFCLIISVCVLFTGCGETDLSEVNKQIANLQNQITTLQTELQNAKGDISSLQSQLAVASANYDKLSSQVYGTDPSYKKINETTTYSHNGIKLFDFTPTSSTIGDAGALVYYTIKSNVLGLSTIEDFNCSALLYTPNTELTYKVESISDTAFRFSPYQFDKENTKSGLVYLFVNNTIYSVYQVNFA